MAVSENPVNKMLGELRTLNEVFKADASDLVISFFHPDTGIIHTVTLTGVGSENVLELRLRIRKEAIELGIYIQSIVITPVSTKR